MVASDTGGFWCRDAGAVGVLNRFRSNDEARAGRGRLADGFGYLSSVAGTPLVLLASAIACAGLALLLIPGPIALWHVLLAVACGLAGLSVILALGARDAQRVAREGPRQAIVERIERRLEHLQDVQWELRENEARYRELLDSQDEAIVRRDQEGNLTFANRAFLEAFGVSAGEVLGKPFEVTVCDDNCIEPLTVDAGIRQQRFAQHAVTVAGPRWIEWEEQLVAAAGGGFEVQSVGRDVTEQRLQEAQLAEARDQAEAANRAKSRFLAAMSHEIRTPMNGILGMASLLTETQQTPEQQTYTRAIDQSARTLLALIDEILDFSKIEAGKLELAEDVFALDACVQCAVELLAPRAHEKGLELGWSVDPRLPSLVIGDETRVRQILLNLLSNAVKFTDAGGVSIRVSRVAPALDAPGSVGIDIVVEDTGIGLSPDDMRLLFSEFEQAETAIARRNGGTGLGLAISMQLARAMGGDIRVRSASGRGSTFTAHLVLRSAVAKELGASTADAHGGRVLLAFDRALERQALMHALVSAGIAADQCGVGDAAELIAKSAEDGVPFDKIVIDGELGPGGAGQLLDWARRHGAGIEVRGIVLVNVSARSSLAEFRSAGFDAYLVRPVRPASLLMQLKGAVDASTGCGDRADAGERTEDVATLAGQRVLLAEDNEINALLAKRVLERCGCDYVAVPNGAEAVDAIRRSLAGDAPPVDMILMDVFMPELDGVEAAREIKKLYAVTNDARTAPPIIALTANAFAEDKQRYLEAGMDDYLAKPFDRAGLENLLRRWSRRQGGVAA